MAHVDLSVLVEGLRTSHNRFTSAAIEGTGRFHAIFEALAWVGSIRDRLKDEGRAVPPVVDGLYYVRNLVLHQGVDVLEWALFPGAELGMLVLGESALGGMSRHAWVWPPRTQMPTPRSLTGATEYDSLVAGREAAVVLEQLASAVATL